MVWGVLAGIALLTGLIVWVARLAAAKERKEKEEAQGRLEAAKQHSEWLVDDATRRDWARKAKKAGGLKPWDV